jgi:hypothetical protein
MPNNLERLLLILNEQAELIENINTRNSFRYKSNYRLILETGKPFLNKVEPPPFKGKPKSCFQNCLQGLWDRPQLYYCEGFAITDDVDIAASHAWLLNDKAEVIDPTWTGEMFPGCTYFGVVFDTEFVVSFAAKTRRYGILDNDYMNKHQLLQEGFPEGALHEGFHSSACDSNQA